MDNNTRRNLGILLWAITIILIVGGGILSMLLASSEGVDRFEHIIILLTSSWGGLIIAGLMISGTLFLNNSN